MRAKIRRAIHLATASEASLPDPPALDCPQDVKPTPSSKKSKSSKSVGTCVYTCWMYVKPFAYVRAAYMLYSEPCLICKEQVLDDPVTLQCGHSYCRECIVKWLGKYHDWCPKCRTKASHMTGSDGIAVPTPSPPPTTTTGCDRSGV